MSGQDEKLIISALQDVAADLTAAVQQSIPSDDQIIMDHVRAASIRVKGLLKDLRATHKDTPDG